MSFAYMPLYTGDYQRDTKHLTPEEHGIYLLLLVHCWDQKGPVPLDERRQCGIVNARSGGEIESLRRVLSEFFVRAEDGHYNVRMFEEIARAETISVGRRKGGLEKARRMRDAARHAQAEHKHSLSSASAGSLTPIPILKEKEEKIRAARVASPAPQAPSGVSPEVWQDFKALRARLRAPITPTAMAGIEREAKKAGLSIDDALRTCCERSWRGFKADWMIGDRKQSPTDAAAEAIRMMEERDAQS